MDLYPRLVMIFEMEKGEKTSYLLFCCMTAACLMYSSSPNWDILCSKTVTIDSLSCASADKTALRMAV